MDPVSALIALGILALAAAGCGGGENEQDSGIDEEGHDSRPDEFDAGVEMPPDARPDEGQDRPVDRYEAPPPDRYEVTPPDRYEGPAPDRYEGPAPDRYEAPPPDRYEAPESDRVPDTQPDVDGGLPDVLGDIVTPDRFPDEADRPPDMTDRPRDVAGDRPDDRVDAIDRAPPEAGINYNAFTFPGPISDLDSPSDGVVIALGGTPAKVYRCVVSGIAAASCEVLAEFMTPESGWRDPLISAGWEPVDYLSFAPDMSLVNFWSPSDRRQTILARLDESAAASHEVVAYDRILVSPTYPDWQMTTGGLGAGQASIPGPIHWRFFTPAGLYNPARHIYAESLVYVDSDNYGSLLRRDWLAHSAGYNASCNANMRMNTTADGGVSEMSVLALLNAGRIDASHDYPAQITVLNPASLSLESIKSISVGDVAAQRLRECVVSPSGHDIYMVYGDATKTLAKVNIDTDLKTETPLGTSVVGAVSGIAVDDSNGYIAEDSGRIVFVDLSGGTVRGRKTLPDASTAVVISGSYVYTVAGNNLVAIDPAAVRLE